MTHSDHKKNKIETLTARVILQLDLKDRAFLHEQGQVVVRGFISSLEIGKTTWDLHIYDIQRLDKNTGAWEEYKDKDTYGGQLASADFYRHLSGKQKTFERLLEINDYGLCIYVGPCPSILGQNSPWQSVYWPELDTEALKSGYMAH